MKVKITADSTCDLTAELIEKYGIDIIPVTVVLGSRSGKDGIDITPDDIYSYVDSTGNLPKTSSVNVAEYTQFFSKWTDQGYSVVHFCLGSGFSSQCQNAKLAAQDVENVFVVDSLNLSSGQGLLVLKGAEMAAGGMDAETIYKACTDAAGRVEASFVIDRLDYLFKGGRCSALESFGANLLKLKPCIEVTGNAMSPSHRYRGKIDKVYQEYTSDRLEGRDDIDPSVIFVIHTKCPENDVADVMEQVRSLVPDVGEIVDVTAGATVTTHCGPKTLGVMFMRK